MVRLKGMFWAVFACLVLLCNLAQARPIPFPEKASARYELKSEPLPRFLESFLAENGFSGVISERVKADKRTLNGIRKGTPAQVFSSILQTNQLLSYFDGAVVYVYMASEAVSQFQPLMAERANGVSAALRRMNLDDAFNRTSVDSMSNLIEITGTPRYVEQVNSLLSAVVQKDARQVDFLFIPLRYAWASDRTFVVGGKRVEIPGVATVLRQLMQGTGAGERTYLASRVADSSHAKSPVQATSKLPGGAQVPVPPPTPTHTPGAPPQSEKLDFLDVEIDGDWNDLNDIPEVSPIGEEKAARIVADPQRNAIIVRDRAENMAMYKSLVQKLDVPTQVIEIEATIIDVYTDRLLQTGVDWRFGTQHGEVMTGEKGDKDDFLNALVGDSIAELPQVPGMQVGAIIGDQRRFIARLQLLEREGLAKVAARPKVVTLNDLEAALESSRSVYVPVSGAYDVDLFKVFSGTVLRVTPHVIEDEDATRIRLIIAAEDGAVDDDSTTGGPAVTRNAVSTQAVIQTNTSLLLGGLSRTETIDKVRKVPFLGDIPLLGKLFRVNSKSAQKSERLFLISPRILDAGTMDDVARNELKLHEPDADFRM